jgi:hypothetical protein
VVTYAANITDAGQYILQEAFTKVGHELETTQENLITNQLVIEMIGRDYWGRAGLTWQLPQSTASLKSFQIVLIQLSVAPAWTPGSDARGASTANRTACFI